MAETNWVPDVTLNVLSLLSSGRSSRRARQNGVLIVGNFLSATGGKRSVCEDLADKLEAFGWKTVRTSTRVSSIPKLWDILKTIWSKRSLYDVAQVDVFSGKAFIWAFAACSLLRALSKPYILSLHGGNLPKFAQRWPFPVHWLIKSAAGVTAPSNYLLRSFLRVRPDLQLLPNGLSLKKYTFRSRIQPGPKLIWVRSFHEMYNPLMAINVTAALRSLYPDIHLTMVGPDRGDGSLQRAVAHVDSLELSRSVTIIPGVDKKDIPSLLEAADIFINTTNIDNAPVTVFEAMACGLCIISTNVGGIPDILTSGENAILVPPEDADAMAHAIVSILTNETASSSISSQAYEKAREADWSKVIPRWTELLEAASRTAQSIQLNGGRPPQTKYQHPQS